MKRLSLVLWLCACGSQEPGPGTSGSGSAAGSAAAGSAAAGSAKPASAQVAVAGAGAGTPAAAPICIDEATVPEGYGTHTVAAVEGGLLRVCREQSVDDKVLRACVALDLATGKPSRAADTPLAPPARIAAGKYESRDGKPVACASDGACRPIGKKLGRYLKSLEKEKENEKEKQPLEVSVTSDGEVVMAEYQAWSLRKDKRLKLAVPKHVDSEYSKYGEFSPVGRFIMGSWNPCAGPCTVHRLYTPDGKVVIDQIETEDGPHVVDATTWGLLTDKLEVFDLATGKRLRQIAVIPDADPPTYTAGGAQYLWGSNALSDPHEIIPIVPLPEGRVAVVFYSEPVVAIVSLAQGKVESRIRIPICGDTDAADDAEELKEKSK
jgi:hypothetical protein